ncbi:hypothetical protein [Mucilaginibacter aquariorum]|uniref:Uncharacterized protein n=1 Tax=Mucilaginibacter aquariorum TaxID=2967225 RepID=A0ABT1SYA7_9SPHI|nr:hypothetical protein [Mucilaginibacter aquariorum]MCQ6957051.1 hypothetical protein [Mucilaginibacter aquariorum]
MELADKTKFSFSGTDVNGIRSNRLALVASILIDGGLSYMLYQGLNAAFGEKQDPKEAEFQSPGYHSAKEDLENKRPVSDNAHIQFQGKSRSVR